MAIYNEFNLEIHTLVSDVFTVTGMLLEDCDKYTRQKFSRKFEKEVAIYEQNLELYRVMEAKHYGLDVKSIDKSELSGKDALECLMITSESLARTVDRRISSHDKDALKEIAEYINGEYEKCIDIKYHH